MLQVIECRRDDLLLGADGLQLHAVVVHPSGQRSDFLVESVDVLLVEVERLELLLGRAGGLFRIVGVQLDHQPSRLAVDRGRAVGKRGIEVGTSLPLRHILLLALHTFLQGALLGLQAAFSFVQFFAKFDQTQTLGLQFFTSLVVFLFQVVEQFAQLALRLGVIGMVRSATDGTGGSLLELLAQFDDIFAVAQGKGHVEAVVDLLGHILFALQTLYVGRSLLLFHGMATYFCAGLADFLVALGNVFPQGSCHLQLHQAVTIFGKLALQVFAAQAAVRLLVDEQFALERVELPLVVVLPVLQFLRRLVGQGQLLLQFDCLAVLFFVLAGSGVKLVELVLYEVKLFKHQLVDGQLLQV